MLKRLSSINCFLSPREQELFDDYFLMITTEKRYQTLSPHAQQIYTRESLRKLYDEQKYGFSVFNNSKRHLGFCAIKWNNSIDVRLILELKNEYMTIGYCKEVISILENYCFNMLHLKIVYLDVLEKDQHMMDIVEKKGYTIKMKQRDRYFIDGAYQDNLVYGKNEDEFRKE